MSLYTITVLTSEFIVFSKWKQSLNARSCWMLADPGLFLHDSELLCCNISKKDYVFVLILDTSNKKHVFLFSDSFSRMLKTERNPQSRAILSSVSKLLSVWRKERPQSSVHVLLFWLRVLLPGSPPCVNAELPAWGALSFGGWLCHKYPLLEAPVITSVTNGKCGVAGMGHLQPALWSSSVYTGKHSAQLRRWREEITWEKWEAEHKGWNKPGVKATEAKLAG